MSVLRANRSTRELLLSQDLRKAFVDFCKVQVLRGGKGASPGCNFVFCFVSPPLRTAPNGGDDINAKLPTHNAKTCERCVSAGGNWIPFPPQICRQDR